MLFDKTNRLIREISILFEVYPQLFPSCSTNLTKLPFVLVSLALDRRLTP